MNSAAFYHFINSVYSVNSLCTLWLNLNYRIKKHNDANKMYSY